ncbi:hypothetical protein HanPSC8_Chr09g0355381 [Helianthus annuus]|nr:hypothetical protein HanPSC8_Chr09g0355381 [Helianthus annuus]
MKVVQCTCNTYSLIDFLHTSSLHGYAQVTPTLYFIMSDLYDKRQHTCGGNLIHV